jgi:hypothetical protein
MLKTLGTIAKKTFIILIDPSATKIFIYGAMLKIIKVKKVEHDTFSYVEMASTPKQNIGGKVMGCSLKVGYFFTKANLYIMILESYDFMIGMD